MGRQKVLVSNEMIDSASSERDAVQFDTHLLGRVVGIEQNIDARQLADRLINHVRLFGQLQSDGSVRNGRQFDRTARLRQSLRKLAPPGRLEACGCGFCASWII